MIHQTLSYIISHSIGRTKRWMLCLLVVLFSSSNYITPLAAQTDAEMVTIMGRNALSVDDYLTAIRYFNQAIEAKPFLSRPYYYRAYAKLTLEDYLGAEADCSKSIELNPFIVEVYQLRGLCRIHNDNFKGAIDDYTRTLKELPEDQGSRYNRALCFLQEKDYQQADSDLDFMLQKWPNFYRVYMVKAQSLLEQKDTTGSLVWIDSLLTKNPSEGNAWSFKGRYALSQQAYTLADSCLTKAINLTPKDFELYISRAQARHALGKFDIAISDYNQTIDLQPNHFVAHYNRGLLRSFVGDLNRAIKDFDFIIEIEPDNTLAIYNRAQLRAQVGDFKGAIADYSQLINTYPNFYYGYMARAECRRKIGDIKGAQNDETIVARRNLDIAFGRAKKTRNKQVRLRSEHELDQYQQLVTENPDTVRNVFGTLYGKVQNEKVEEQALPMYALAFRPVFTRGYHSIGYISELSNFKSAKAIDRKLCLTAETDVNASQEADYDEKRLKTNDNSYSKTEKALTASAIAAARYDYTSALNEANQAVLSDSCSVVARLHRSAILMRSATALSSHDDNKKVQMTLALADLKIASLLAPENAYVYYNLGCIYTHQKADNLAIDAFSKAIQLDSCLPEAYYNRALIYRRNAQADKAYTDFSKAGQLGLYRAYALMKQQKDK